MRKLALALCFFVPLCHVSIQTNAQIWEVGEIYEDSLGWMEYRPGNLPIVISIPHDGYMVPYASYTRDCEDADTNDDDNTRIIAKLLDTAFMNLLGCRPHIIINRVRRQNLDMNRNITEATCDDPDEADSEMMFNLKRGWQHYHDFINIAKARVIAQYGKGFFLDIHGHGRSPERVHIGYAIDGADLRNEDLDDNDIIEDSNIQGLANINSTSSSHEDLIRGAFSVGTLLENRGFAAIPSQQDPYPTGSQKYFAGDYLSRTHGSRKTNSPLFNALNFEIGKEIRYEEREQTGADLPLPGIRKKFADSLALTLKEFIARFSIAESQLNACAGMALPGSPVSSFTAQKLSGFNRLSWRLSQTVDIESVTILRSYNGLDFASIHTISGITQTDYTYNDNASDRPVTYYQLKVKFKNGELAVSQVVMVNRQATQHIVLKKSFTPDNANFLIQLTATKSSKLTVELFDILGKELLAKEFTCSQGDNQISMDIHSLSKGIYGIVVLDENGSVVGNIKFRKQ